jgi:hypothetical protein
MKRHLRLDVGDLGAASGSPPACGRFVDRLARTATNASAPKRKRWNQNGTWPTHSLLVHRAPAH